MAKVTATQLRSELYRLLDKVAETGEPLEIERPAGRLEIRRASSARVGKRKLRIKKNPGFIVGDPDDLVHIDWLKYWKPIL